MLVFLYPDTGLFSENTLHTSHNPSVYDSGSPALLCSLG